ncbi:MAG: ATP-binding protein [Rhodospirillales bacterium]|nr:ATP-binding protein [Rhodospirillales bacterium]
MPLIPRHLTEPLRAALAGSRIVNVVGPRQDGKSTLVRDLIDSAVYITLDDDAIRQSLSTDPYAQLKDLSDGAADTGLPIVIDEVQRLPEITLALKRIVDMDRRKGHFLLTGSADIFTSGKAIDSLAGRVSTLILRPFSAAEIVRAGPCRILDAIAQEPADPMGHMPKAVPCTRRDIVDFIVRGGFPEFRELSDRDRMNRCKNYVDSMIERDMAAVHNVRKPDAVRRLVSQAAARTSQEFNPVTLGSDLGIKYDTVTNYVDALTKLGIVLRLGAWSSSKAKREIKAAKLHFMDTGLATALRGEDSSSFGIKGDPEAFGALFETFVFTEIEKSLPYLSNHWSLWHWRADGREIDIVAESPGRKMALFEIKASSSVSKSDFRHLEWFLRQGPGKSHRGVGIVVYTGERLLSFGPGLIALPVSTFWSSPR